MENKKYLKYKFKYKTLKKNLSIEKLKFIHNFGGSENTDVVKLKGVVPDLYVNKDMIIVGGSPHLLENDYRFIDNHKCVVRMNTIFYTDPFYYGHAGSKCDILFFFCFPTLKLGSESKLCDPMIKVLNTEKYRHTKIITSDTPSTEYLRAKLPGRIYTSFEGKSGLPESCHWWSIKSCMSELGFTIDKIPYATSGLYAIILAVFSGIIPKTIGYSKIGGYNKSIHMIRHRYKDQNSLEDKYKKYMESDIHEYNSKNLSHKPLFEYKIRELLSEKGLIKDLDPN